MDEENAILPIPASGRTSNVTEENVAQLMVTELGGTNY